MASLASKYVSLHYDYEYGTPEDAVLAFQEDWRGTDKEASAIAGLDALLAEYPDEAARRVALRELRFGYGPREGMLDEFLIWTRATLLNDSGK